MTMNTMKRILVMIGFVLLVQTVFADTMMVEVTANEFDHQVTNVWQVEGDFSDRSYPVEPGHLKVMLWRGDAMVNSYVVRNPLSLHTPLIQSGEFSAHEEVELYESIYHLRLPVEQGITRVTIQVIDDATGALARSAFSAPAQLVLDHQF